MKDNEFKKLVGRKIIENLISVKVWVIFILMFLSASMVYTGLMPAAIWASVNGGVISTVFTMREVFKVAKIKQLSEKDVNDMVP